MALLGFGWLRHLRAADTALTRANARSLVDDWISNPAQKRPVGRRADVLARRVISLLSQAPLVLNDTDGKFYRRYLRGLTRETEALLATSTPVIARMETLRRAAIYASRDPAVAKQLLTRLQARGTLAKTADARALARIDAGYFAATLEDVVRLQGYDMPGIGKVDAKGLRAVLANVNGSAEVDAALAARPNDAAMRFAAALIASADQRGNDYAAHARVARSGANRDRLLALNLHQIAN